jgi:DNA repair protein SbcD/Mre11
MTRGLRLIHVADCHLDAPSHSLDRGVRVRIEQSARTALERAVALAVDGAADALLIAGDTFDRDSLRVATEVWLPEVLGEAVDAGVTVVVVTGNHDPGAVGGPLDRLRLPDAGFHLVRHRSPVIIPIPAREGGDAGLVVAAGHESAREQENLAATFPAAPAGVAVAGLLHAQVVGYETGGHDRYAPCTTDDLRRPGYGYWALGHVHAPQQVLANPLAWYAGCLQGRDFGETGPKGVLEVEVRPDGGASAAFLPLAPVRWETLAVGELQAVADMAALVERIEGAFDDLAASRDVLAGQDWMLRFDLTGPCPLTARLRQPGALDDLEAVVATRLRVLGAEVRAARLLPAVDADEHRGAPHVLGIALDLLAEAAADPAAAEALAPKLAGAPADEARRAAYVRALLDGLDVEIAAAMLAEADER